MSCSFIQVAGRTIAYHHFKGCSEKPAVIFCGGYMSDMEGSKALFFEEFCKSQNISFIRFDYSGHGQSSEKFTDGTIGSWTEDAVGIVEELISGDFIIIGSSMGGWIGLLLGEKYSARVTAFIGIAAAPDFTRDLMWNGYDEAIKTQLRETGVYLEPSEYSDEPYHISYEFITEADQHLILERGINLTCPVRLFHGCEDEDVPPEWASKISSAVASDDVISMMIKKGNHRLSTAADLKRYASEILELISVNKD